MTRESGCIAKRWLQGHRPNYDWMDTGSIHMQIHWTLVAMYTHVNTQHTRRYHSMYKKTLIHGVFILIYTPHYNVLRGHNYTVKYRNAIYMQLALNNREGRNTFYSDSAHYVVHSTYYVPCKLLKTVCQGIKLSYPFLLKYIRIRVSYAPRPPSPNLFDLFDPPSSPTKGGLRSFSLSGLIARFANNILLKLCI